MYTIYVNEAPLIVTHTPPETLKEKVFSTDRDSLLSAITLLYKGALTKAYLYHPKGQDITQVFSSTLPVLVAGGGLVTNPKGEILFIFKDGKWDLPKGKVEAGESLESAALREVEEETGVQDLTVKKSLCTTSHIFKRNGEYQLKHVHWFAMTTPYSGPLKGQNEEGITIATWKGRKATIKALKNTYINIKVLLEA